MTSPDAPWCVGVVIVFPDSVRARKSPTAYVIMCRWHESLGKGGGLDGQMQQVRGRASAGRGVLQPLQRPGGQEQRESLQAAHRSRVRLIVGIVAGVLLTGVGEASRCSARTWGCQGAGSTRWSSDQSSQPGLSWDLSRGGMFRSSAPPGLSKSDTIESGQILYILY